jgi:hypothetical protein
MTDILVDISANNNVVSRINPFLEFNFEVLKESHTGVCVIILRLEVLPVLGSDSEGTKTIVRTVDGDTSKHDLVFPPIAGPSPSSQFSFVTSSPSRIM